jgi:Protein of unknown function (DUF3574)
VIRLGAAAPPAAALSVGLLLAGCIDPPPVCTVPAEHAMLVAELFFGRTIAPAYQRELGATVTDTQWAAFARTVLTPAFSDGLTTLDAQGQWRDPSSSLISHEPTTLVIVAAPYTGKTRQDLSDVMAQYRAQFHQQSVGLILRRDCASF